MILKRNYSQHNSLVKTNIMAMTTLSSRFLIVPYCQEPSSSLRADPPSSCFLRWTCRCGFMVSGLQEWRGAVAVEPPYCWEAWPNSPCLPGTRETPQNLRQSTKFEAARGGGPRTWRNAGAQGLMTAGTISHVLAATTVRKVGASPRLGEVLATGHSVEQGIEHHIDVFFMPGHL